MSSVFETLKPNLQKNLYDEKNILRKIHILEYHIAMDLCILQVAEFSAPYPSTCNKIHYMHRHYKSYFQIRKCSTD